MTNDANKIPRDTSLPPDQVISCASRGESNSRGMGPFFLTFFWPGSGRTRMCPIPFESVEDALAYLGLRLLDNPNCVEPGSWVTVCFQLGSTRLQ
jgi:hypothetical protein